MSESKTYILIIDQCFTTAQIIANIYCAMLHNQFNHFWISTFHSRADLDGYRNSKRISDEKHLKNALRKRRRNKDLQLGPLKFWMSGCTIKPYRSFEFNFQRIYALKFGLILQNMLCSNSVKVTWKKFLQLQFSHLLKARQ